jgi:hypothetical protein
VAHSLTDIEQTLAAVRESLEVMRGRSV